MSNTQTRYVTSENMIVEELPWGPHEWLCRPDIVAADKLLLVRVRMPAGKAHEFHRHPEMEEIIYVEQGTAEQFLRGGKGGVARRARILLAQRLEDVLPDVGVFEVELLGQRPADLFGRLVGRVDAAAK